MAKIPPQPVGVPFGHSFWNDWIEKLRNQVNNPGDHNDLQNIQGGSTTERYHLSAAQYNNLGKLVSGTSFTTGQVNVVTGGVTLNTSDMDTDRVFYLYNNSAGSITLTQGSGVTLRLGGSATTGNRTVAQRTFATIWCLSGTEAIITGTGVT